MLAQLISNLLFCSVFGLAASGHIMKFEEELPKLTANGIPEEYAQYCMGAAIGLLVIGTVCIITTQFEMFGYMAYVLFLIPVTWFMHATPMITAMFVEDDAAKQVFQTNMIQVLKNMSLIGACFKFMIIEAQKANRYVEAKKRKKYNRNKKRR